MGGAEVVGGYPKVNQVSAGREDLVRLYAECVRDNPLLGRIEGEARTVGWTDFEIRTLQLLTAVKSNSSLQQRIHELEEINKRMIANRGG